MPLPKIKDTQITLRIHKDEEEGSVRVSDRSISIQPDREDCHEVIMEYLISGKLREGYSINWIHPHDRAGD